MMRAPRRGRRGLVATLLGAVVAALGVAGPAAGAAGDASRKGGLFEFRCDGFGAFIPVDPATVREVGNIPAAFKLQAEEQTGRAVVLVAAFKCDYLVDGAAFPGVSYSNVTANLDAPPAVCPSCGAGGYDIWQFTDEQELHTMSARIGVFQPLVRKMSVTLDYVAGLPLSGRAVVPWDGSPYEIAARVPPNAVPFFRALDGCSSSPPAPTTDPSGCFASDHWFQGGQGAVYTAHANCEVTGGAAEVTVQAQAGSPLARILGAERVQLPGLWLRTERARAFMDFATRFASGDARRPSCLGS
jgi:hypothetical protein